MARNKQPKTIKARNDDDTAAIRQRKGYRRKVLRVMGVKKGSKTVQMVSGTVTTRTFGQPSAGLVKPKGRGVKVLAQHVGLALRTVEKISNNPRNRNTRIAGVTVGEAWKLDSRQVRL